MHIWHWFIITIILHWYKIAFGLGNDVNTVDQLPILITYLRKKIIISQIVLLWYAIHACYTQRMNGLSCQCGFIASWEESNYGIHIHFFSKYSTLIWMVFSRYNWTVNSCKRQDQICWQANRCFFKTESHHLWSPQPVRDDWNTTIICRSVSILL